MARILIIDDDEPLRRAVGEILTHAGHSTLEASDGHQGLRQFRATPVDLVLTDLVMPGKEGVETIIDLHRLRPGLPIVAMSGGMERSATYLEIAAKLGANRVLLKPFLPQQLLAAIDAALGGSPPKSGAT